MAVDFHAGHSVQVLSKSSGAWVDAVVHQVLANGAVWVRYGSAQKVIPVELQASTLRRRQATGERVEVYSKSQLRWIAGRVREIWPDGSVHVQYEDAQHLYKVIAPELQDSLLRPPQILEVSVQGEQRCNSAEKDDDDARSCKRPRLESPARDFLRRATVVLDAEKKMVELGDLKMRQSFHEKLCPYQREGVAWMWGLLSRRQGGILADDMGLGKTVQACALIDAMQAAGSCHVLVVMPVTLLDQWSKELARWCPECQVYIYHGSSSQRLRALRAVKASGGVLLTSYAIAKNEDEKLALATDVKPWDLVICDEAHVMRTISTLLGKAMRNLRAHCRILLTGTPVQNALQDLWALMDFAQPGLLGNHATFTKRFNDPIEKGSLRDASASAVALKKHLCEQLWTLAKPHMLRRTKDDATPLGQPLPARSEFVVWLTPSKDQVQTYQKALETSDVIREANSKSKLGVEVFRAIGLLKRLCNHPVLAVSPEAWKELLAKSGVAHQVEDAEEAAEEVEPGKAVERMLKTLKRDPSSLVSQSAKLQCLSSLLPALAEKGHRTLIFSQGVRMMDLVEMCVLQRLSLSYLRIDGQTEIHLRNERVRKFQEEAYSCMLLTTKVGGFGLNLTAADRVIILDPAWNPAVDMQAVDRAHRIGQEKEVKTYRLIMSGLIEDKMFRLQVFKMGLTKTALESKQQQRYFTADEIHGLFQWTDPAQGETRQLLRDMHGIEDCQGSDGGLSRVAGLSSFSYLYQSLQTEVEDMAPEVRLMKAQLKVAEDATNEAAGRRREVEHSLQTAQQELQKTVADLSGTCRSSRSQAAQKVKRAQALLAQSERREGPVSSELERLGKLREESLQKLTTCQEQLRTVEQEVSSCELGVQESSGASAQAELHFMALIEAVDIQGVEKASTRLTQAMEALRQARSAAATAWETLLDIEARSEECQAELNIVMEGLGASVPLKASQATRRGAEKEKAQADKLLAKAVVTTSKVAEQLNQAVAEYRKLLVSGGEATRDQALSDAWQQLLELGGVSAKLQAQHHRALRGRLSGRRKVKEQTARHAAADRAYAKAAADMEALQEELQSRRKTLEEAEVEQAELAEVERLKKRKRDECKASISEAKETLKSARLAEKGAAAERTALYKHYAAADETLKGALRSARLNEQTAAEERRKAVAAIEALKAEEYDANQVIEAYESKKRLRADDT